MAKRDNRLPICPELIAHWDAIARKILPVLLLFLIKPGLNGIFRISGPFDFYWVYMQNVLFNTAYVFGRDVVYSYGPLALLLVPLHIQDNIILYFVFRLIVWLYCLVMLYEILHKERRVLHIAIPLVVLSGIFCLPHLDTGDNLVILFIAASIFEIIYANKFFNLIVSFYILIAGVLILAKFSYAALMLPSLFIAIFFKYKVIIKNFIGFIGFVLASLSLVAILYHHFFSRLNDFYDYIHYSVEISKGYTFAAGHGGDIGALFSIFIISALIALSLYLRRYGKQRLQLLIAYFPLVFALFKHGFTRYDLNHAFSFFSAIVIISTFFCFKIPNKKHGNIALGVLLIVFVVSLPALSFKVDHDKSSYVDIEMYSSLIKNALKSVVADNFAAELFDVDLGRADHDYSKNFDKDIPSDIYKSCKSFSVFPDDFSLAFHNLSLWSPLYVLQTNLASTEELNRKLASKLDEYEDDRCIFLHVGGYYPDNRSVILDNPDIFLSFAKKYSSEKESYFVKFKKLNDRPTAFTPVQSFDAPLDQEIILPQVSGKLFASMAIKQDFLGKLMSTFYKVPDLNLVYKKMSGENVERHITPGVLSSPFIPNLIPDTSDDFIKYFAGNVSSDVYSIKIDGPGLPYYNPVIHVTFYNLSEE
jgi:hypothetical protein